jgi:putative solute:sodium symporter small subunit
MANDQSTEVTPVETGKISEAHFKAYWRANLLLMAALLAIWALVSFGAAILFREKLDQFSIGGAPFGFWMAQQGSIYVFVILIFAYSVLMHRLERKYGIDDDKG